MKSTSALIILLLTPIYGMSQDPDTLTVTHRAIFNVAVAGDEFSNPPVGIAIASDPDEGFAAANAFGTGGDVDVENNEYNAYLNSTSGVGAKSENNGTDGAGASSSITIYGDVFVPNGEFINEPNKADIGVSIDATVLPVQPFDQCTLGCGFIIDSSLGPVTNYQWIFVWNQALNKFEYAFTIDGAVIDGQQLPGGELVHSDGAVYKEFVGDQDEVISVNFTSINVPAGVGNAAFTTPASMQFLVSF